MSDIATLCTSDLVTKLQGLINDPLGDKVLSVFSEDDFYDKVKLLKTPFAGVMYGGIRSIPADPSRQGMSTELVVTIIYGFTSRSVAGHDAKAEAWALLSKGRNAIKMTYSPSGHKWKFQSEVYMGVEGSIAMFSQQWATFVALTSSNF